MPKLATNSAAFKAMKLAKLARIRARERGETVPPLKDIASASVHLTIAYMTGRIEPKIEWFLDSLMSPPQSEALGQQPYQIIVVDFFKDQRGPEFRELLNAHRVWHVEPKPTVWQGKHRLTKVDYFAAANARNTAICYAPDGWIAFVDDLSVLGRHWLASVREAIKWNYIGLGAYHKVKDLVVHNGGVLSLSPYPPGVDSRWGKGQDGHAVEAEGNWLFGCSFAAPVEALLAVNGLDEDCDSTGLGSEDYILGIHLKRHGWNFKYDRRMFTYEDEDLHFQGNQFTRSDKGESPNDKSHAMLARANVTNKAGNQHLGAGGIRALRSKILGGEPFPVPTGPTVDWYDQQPLSEL